MLAQEPLEGEDAGAAVGARTRGAAGLPEAARAGVPGVGDVAVGHHGAVADDHGSSGRWAGSQGDGVLRSGLPKQMNLRFPSPSRRSVLRSDGPRWRVGVVAMMRTRRRGALAVASALVLLSAGPAGAGDFAPGAPGGG